jgi:hypothetical protein
VKRLYGVLAWTHRALNSRKRRVPARAVTLASMGVGAACGVVASLITRWWWVRGLVHVEVAYPGAAMLFRTVVFCPYRDSL